MGAAPISQQERISCLMVTQPVPQRWEMFRRSVACFQAQTYSQRELVVVLDEGPAEGVRRVRKALDDIPGVAAVVQPTLKMTLGALHNVAIELAAGALLCKWDDDDLSHPCRLQEQHRLLRDTGALAVGLQEFLLFFSGARRLHWITFGNGLEQCIAGTLMFRREAGTRCPEDGPNARKRVDSALLRGLLAKGEVACLAGMAHLYVYVCHGMNTWDGEHFREMVQEQSISRALLLRRRSLVEKATCLDLGEGLIDVVGHNGLAYQIAGKVPANE